MGMDLYKGKRRGDCVYGEMGKTLRPRGIGVDYIKVFTGIDVANRDAEGYMEPKTLAFHETTIIAAMFMTHNPVRVGYVSYPDEKTIDVVFMQEGAFVTIKDHNEFAEWFVDAMQRKLEVYFG